MKMPFCLALIGMFAQINAQGHNYVPREGYVPDGATAISIGRAVLVPIYGKDKIKSEEPLHARLEKGIWIVQGSLKHEHGGVAEIRISKATAQIVRVTHGK